MFWRPSPFPLIGLLAGGLLLDGCAAPASYPSLLPRAVEAPGRGERPAAEPAPEAADPALHAQVAASLRLLDERTTAFNNAATSAARTVAAAHGASAGSEAWLNAQVALAELDTLRSATVELATDLDAVAGERALRLAPEQPTLNAAIEHVRLAAAAQANRIAELQERLAPT